MKHLLPILAVLFLFQTITTAQDKFRNNLEKAADHKQIATSKAQLDRDTKELANFKKKRDLFAAAWATKDKERCQTLKASLLVDMNREVDQANKKIAQAKADVNQSRVEVHHDKKELNRDGRGLRDKINRADDIGDLHDDKKDLADRVTRRDNQKKLYEALKAVTFDLEGAQPQANKDILSKFITTMENDIKATQRELGEDKGELREDRKETREDRRG